MKITRLQMYEILEDWDRVSYFLHYINEWCDVFHINTPLRLAHFMAQVCHETNGLRCMRELGNPSYFRKYEEGRLGKMLGNIMKGDGARYKGRGLMHITGRANYKAYQDSGYCKGDIMEHPELLEKPLGATKSGAWWWWNHGLNELADKDDVAKRINGGTNGLTSRKRWLAKCKKVLRA